MSISTKFTERCIPASCRRRSSGEVVGIPSTCRMSSPERRRLSCTTSPGRTARSHRTQVSSIVSRLPPGSSQSAAADRCEIAAPSPAARTAARRSPLPRGRGARHAEDAVVNAFPHVRGAVTDLGFRKTRVRRRPRCRTRRRGSRRTRRVLDRRQSASAHTAERLRQLPEKHEPAWISATSSLIFTPEGLSGVGRERCRRACGRGACRTSRRRAPWRTTCRRRRCRR